MRRIETEKAPVLDWANAPRLPRSQVGMLKFGQFPVNANTYSGSFLTDNLIDEAVASASGTFAMLNACTNMRDPDIFKPFARDIVKYVTKGGGIQTNPTDYEPSTTPDSALTPVPITTTHYNQPFYITGTDLNNGVRIDDLFLKAFGSFAATLTGAVASLFTGTNFPNATVNCATTGVGGFDKSNAAAAYGSIGNAAQKFLILNSNWFAGLNSSLGDKGIRSGDSALGFAGVSEQSKGWDQADPSINGIALGKEAIVIVNGQLNFAQTNGTIARRVLMLPNGLTISVNSWFNTRYETYYHALDCVLGAGVADNSVGTLIKSLT